jgi:hemolysin activation/secretion protein
MDPEPLCADQPVPRPAFYLGAPAPKLTMQMMKRFLFLGATALVMTSICGRAADADTEAQTKARAALRERERQWGGSPPATQLAPVAPADVGAKPQAPAAIRGTDTEAQIKAQEAVRGTVQQPLLQPGLAATNAPAPEQPADFRKVPRIKGIVIVRSLKEFNPDGVPLKPGLSVTNNALLERSQFARLAASYLEQPMDETRMRELQREIILYYRQHDRPLVDVLYPEQDVSNGMLQIIVIEGRLKEVRVQDKRGNPYTNGWTGVKFVHDSVHLRTNDVIFESRVTKDVDWLNRNPFRTVEAVYEPDKREYGKTSLLLRVDEQRQWSADFGYEDSGSTITSEDRLIAGFTWGKAFGLEDNQFRYAFTFDPSFDLLRVHSASYYLPLPWRHGLRFSGYYLDVKGDLGGGSTLSGSAYQASVRYEVPLPSIGKFQHEASVGLDFKRSENNLFFNEVSFVNTPAEIFQAAAGYSAVLPDAWGQTSLSIQGYYSPGGVTEKNSDEAFNLARPLAKASYVYGRFSLERVTQLPVGFTWIIRAIGQLADGNLLPSEQLGMGGYATVRGYEEREGNGDQGYFISNELRTPALNLSHLFTKNALFDDKVQLLGFWDYGEIRNVNLLSSERPEYHFSSIGPGMRYSLSKHFSLRFDYGWQLHDSGLSPVRQHSRAHLGVVATY